MNVEIGETVDFIEPLLDQDLMNLLKIISYSIKNTIPPLPLVITMGVLTHLQDFEKEERETVIKVLIDYLVKNNFNIKSKDDLLKIYEDTTLNPKNNTEINRHFKW